MNKAEWIVHADPLRFISDSVPAIRANPLTPALHLSVTKRGSDAKGCTFMLTLDNCVRLPHHVAMTLPEVKMNGAYVAQIQSPRGTASYELEKHPLFPEGLPNDDEPGNDQRRSGGHI